MVILSWHGWRSALTREGRMPDRHRGPAGIEMELRAQVTHIGVPMHHRGEEPHIRALLDAGFHIIRTMEPPWNAGRPGLAGLDLGRVLMEWEGVDRPGKIFCAFRENLHLPIDGFAWNLEHNPSTYPVTPADRQWAELVGIPWEDLVSLRCSQFSALMRLYGAVASEKAGYPVPTFAYSGYSGIAHNGVGVREAYACDWSDLARSFYFRGQWLPPLNYACPSWHGITLPEGAGAACITTLHNIGLPHYAVDSERWRDYRLVVEDRYRRAKEDGGLCLVACSPLTGGWNKDEDKLRIILSEVLR